MSVRTGNSDVGLAEETAVADKVSFCWPVVWDNKGSALLWTDATGILGSIKIWRCPWESYFGGFITQSSASIVNLWTVVYGLLDMMISSSNPMKICKVKINCVLYLRVWNKVIESIVLVFQNYFKWYSLIKSNITRSGFNNCRWLTIFLMILKIFKRMEKCWHCVMHWDIKK